VTITLIGSYVLVWALVVFHSLIIVVLLKQLADLRARATSGQLSTDRRLPLGTVVPTVTIVNPRTGAADTASLFAEGDAMLLFLSPECSTCAAIAAHARLLPEAALNRIAVICSGTESACRTLASLAGPRLRMVHNSDQALPGHFGVSGYPTAVVVESGWRVRGYIHPRDVAEIIAWADTPAPSHGTSSMEREHEFSTT
jgi:hypothetical protein